MKTLITLSLLATTASAIIWTGDGLTERFEQGAEFTTTITMESESVLEDSQTLIGGNEMPMPGEMTREVTASSTISYTDTVTKADGGRLLNFQRVYNDAENSSSTQMMDPMGGDHSTDVNQASLLLDIPILFTRDEDLFTASYPEDSDGDVDWLEGLSATPNWSLLLPDASAEVDDEWEIDGVFLRELREPGGDLAWEADTELDPSKGEIIMPPGFLDYAGEITATLVSLEDGVAKVELEVECTASADLTELLPEDGIQIGDEDSGMPTPEVESVIIEYDIEGTGHFLWNLRTGQLTSLILELESEEIETVELTMDMGGNVMEIESITTSIITETIEVVVE